MGTFPPAVWGTGHILSRLPSARAMLGLLLLMVAAASGQKLGGYCGCGDCLEVDGVKYSAAPGPEDGRCGEGCPMVKEGYQEVCVCSAPINVASPSTEYARACGDQGCLFQYCCQQLKDNRNESQYILTKNELGGLYAHCWYRNIEDISSNPITFMIGQYCGKPDPNLFECLDEKLRHDCSTPKFETWYDVISRCFYQDTEGMELMHSSFCQPKPDGTFTKDFSKQVDELEKVVNNNATLVKLSEEMWTNSSKVFNKFCPGNFSNMLRYMKIVMSKAPQFMANTTPSGLPQIQMLHCYMATQAGKQFFMDTDVNNAIINIENAWGKFLDSKESLSVLNDGQFGWMGPCAVEKINITTYVHDPNKPHWGFTSWNDFFIRRLNNQSEVRPNRCEGDPTCLSSYGDTRKIKIRKSLTLKTSVKAKNEDYSLHDLFANETLANYFVGGSLIQTIFMPYNYHWYHAPVSGTVVFAKVIPGFIYTVYNTTVNETAAGTTDKEHFNYWLKSGVNVGYVDSLTYIAPLATRGIVVIKTESFGYVGVIAIGLQTISSVNLNEEIKPNHKVTQGDQLGNFKYGGSSGIIVVEDPHFEWFPGTNGTGGTNDLYMLGDKMGKFRFCSPGSGMTCSASEEITSDEHWGALGFPVI